MIVEKARTFALKAHGDRKYGEHPYSYHLDSVAQILEPYGELAKVIGYLHDVVEDTNVNLVDIEKEFGKIVADCVSILTDEPGQNRRERKLKTYQKMANVRGDVEIALVVKAADRLANVLACIEFNKLDKWTMYKEEYELFKKSVFRPHLCDCIWLKLDRLI